MLTVGQLLEKYTNGNIILVDSTTQVDAGIIPAQSPIITLIKDKNVVDWQACKTSSSTAKIKIFCALS